MNDKKEYERIKAEEGYKTSNTMTVMDVKEVEKWINEILLRIEKRMDKACRYLTRDNEIFNLGVLGGFSEVQKEIDVIRKELSVDKSNDNVTQ